LSRQGWIERILSAAREVARSLEGCPPDQLQQHTLMLRRFLLTGASLDETRFLTLGAAAVIEATRQTLGLRLFDAQLHAGVIVSRGAVAEMQTGEGKTLAIALPAYLHAIGGRGVHIATPNSYLASRDHQQLAPVFARLGITTGLLQDGAKLELTRAAYQADVTYGPGHAFGFDYLRDQVTLDGIRSSGLGQRLYTRLCGDASQPQLLQRGLYAAIIDEIDHVLIDDGVSPLLLSDSPNATSPDAEVHLAAGVMAESLELSKDFHILGQGIVELTRSGFDRVYAEQVMAVHPQLLRPWHEYVVLALRAGLVYRRDVDYVVRDQQVQIVDASTGRIFADRTWSDGLHQAIEAREQLPIRRETMPLARITRQRFYRYYESLGGLTGTATGCEREFAEVYGLPVAVVPLRVASQRVQLPEHVSRTPEEKLLAIAEETEFMVRQRRAVLIGTTSIEQSIEIAGALRARGLCCQLLNGVQDADEAAIVAQAGRRGAITVATNLAGRGTDIRLDPEVAHHGGLHVIVGQKHRLERVDRQLIGRSGRCGDPGSARIYICAEDSLVRQRAPWISRAIERWDRHGRRHHCSLEQQFARLQSREQRTSAALRWRLLLSDHDDERLLDKSPASPQRCCQL
jgi:preprotein translocase subunit SecA